MVDNLFKNAEGYSDYTAGYAIRSVERSYNMSEIYEGDIWKIDAKGSDREFLVLNVFDKYASGILLCDKISGDNPVKVISMTPKYIDLGKITYVFLDRFADFVKSIGQDELSALKTDVAMTHGFLSKMPNEDAKQKDESNSKDVVVVREDSKETKEALQKALIERDVYKDLYMELLARVTK